jgi:hypothetical protein
MTDEIQPLFHQTQVGVVGVTNNSDEGIGKSGPVMVPSKPFATRIVVMGMEIDDIGILD